MSRRRTSIFLLALLALAALPAQAQQATVPLDASAIGASAGRGVSGRTAVNLAAGSGNLQANVAAFALSPDGNGRIDLSAAQSPQAGTALRDASVHIDGRAFTRSTGLLSVNQVAGSGNAQLNLFALGNGDITVAASALDDAALATVAGEPTDPTTGPAPAAGLRQASIADDAFRGGQGVVQLNQTAGIGNVSANAIVLQLPGGTP